MRKIYFYFVLFLVVFHVSTYGQTYYVSNSGKDSYTTTQAQSTSTPWKTIQHACNNATPGTTIEIMAGTYVEQINIPVSGSPTGGYITLTNYNGGKAIISGNGTAATLLNINSKNYIKINGLEFYNCIGNNTSIGLFVDGVSNHIEITNNTIHHIYWNSSFTAVPTSSDNVNPLVVWGDSVKPLKNLIISGNTFYDNAPGFSEVCSIDGNVDTFSMVNNNVHNNQNIGLDVEGNYGVGPVPATDHARNGLIKGNKIWKCHSVYDGSAAGIYVDGGYNITIEQNESYNNDWGIEIGCEQPKDTTESITVRDNIMYRNGNAGMQFGGYNGPTNTGRVINSEVSNNTFFDNDTLAQGNGELSLSYSENCSFYNNIFYAGSTTLLSSGWNNGNSIGFKFDYNRYYSLGSDSVNATFAYGTNSYTGFANYKTGSGFDTHSKYSDPGLMSTTLSTLNLNLLSSSTCKNNGMPAWPVDTGERDFNGNSRIIGGRIDIGAYEYQGTTAVNELRITNEELKIWPNPSKGLFNLQFNRQPEFVEDLIKVYNSIGQEIYSNELLTVHSQFSINLGNQSAGIYLYRILSNDGAEIAVGKLIIEK